MFKVLSVAVLVCSLAACGAPQPRPRVMPRAVPPANPPATAGTKVFRVDGAQSELRVLVYRAGPLARLGHNHVMINRALQGSVNLANPRASSWFSLRVPVADFAVDEVRSRTEEGSDFPGDISDDAKSGTRSHMLGSSVLSAADFPVIAIESRGVIEKSGALIASLVIRVAGHESTIEVPFLLTSEPQRLTAVGAVDLSQSAIGLTPFSLMMGALQVQDGVRLKFKIVAVTG